MLGLFHTAKKLQGKRHTVVHSSTSPCFAVVSLLECVSKEVAWAPPSLKSRGRQQQVEVVERENNVHAISKLVQAQLSISESFLSPRRSSIPLPKATTVQTHPKPSAMVSYCYTCTHTPKCWKIAQNVSFANF